MRPMTTESPITRRHVVQGLSLLPLWTGASAQPADPDLQALLNARVDAEGVGLVAGLVDGRSVRTAHAGVLTGAQTTSGPEPMTVDARFEWGSITKTFTALLLADMVLRRELALADAVESVFAPGLKLRDSAGEPIRFLDLATHRSGLPRLPGNMAPAQADDPYADYTPMLLEAFLKTWKAEVPRNEAWLYSNLGFGLLGHALALRLGLSFDVALRNRVLLPLGLPGVRLNLRGATTAGAARTLPGEEVQGHNGERRPVPRWHFDALAGAGALVGSISELLRYAQAALGLIETPLAPAFQLALARHAAGSGSQAEMGLAWVLLGRNKGGTLAAHDGSTAGFSSTLFLDPAGRRASAVLANAAVPVNDLALHLLDNTAPLRNPAAERAARLEAQQRPVLTLPAEALGTLTGVYALNAQFKLNLSLREGRLWAQATGQGAFELFATGPRTFFARVTPLDIAFEGDSGVPVALLLTQGGARLRFVRE